MITKRLLVVTIVMLAGFSSVAFLPHSSVTSPAGIAMELPIFVGAWMGEDSEVTPREREVLAPDTRFARKTYSGPRGDKIFVSIVMSGDDMTNSIHRPERCLPAQGWSLESSGRQVLPIAGHKQIAVTKLRDVRMMERKKEAPGALLHGLSYYWFIGYQDMTPSHLERTGIDLRDRILHGYNQRWAYVTIASIVTEGWRQNGRSEAATAEMTENFIKELVPKLKRPDGSTLL
jgi:EpsI family protein